MAIKNGFNGPTPAKQFKPNPNNLSHQNGHPNGIGVIVKNRKIQPNFLNDRNSLPIYVARDRIIKEIHRNSSVIVIGETGSGKTTQIPQFILQQNLCRNGKICVTQPRRVAAISLSTRVAQEMNCELGKLVGYSVRFDSLVSEETQIQYMTDGMLLREAMHDPLLKNVNVVVLDEVHERTLHTDVVMGVVKQAQAVRRQKCMEELKIVVMSATMDVDNFSAYFNAAPVIYVEGRQHPVSVMYAGEQISDYFHACLVTIFQLHVREPANKDFLVFLTGQDEIEQAVSKIRMVSKELPADKPRINIIPLYSTLAPQIQMRVFQPQREGVRKIILSTNIAETSLTIPGVRVVIDSGKVKSRIFEPSKGVDMLRVVNISKAQACQRAGRAGRESAGSCYRLYREIDYDTWSDSIQPEILRCNLSSVILELLAMRVNNVHDFDFMDKPKQEAIVSAIRELKYLNAVEETSPNTYELTPLGKRMSKFPLDPKLSRVIFAAERLNCVEEALSVVSLMSCDSILVSQSIKKEECEAAHRKFYAPEGDHIFLLNTFKAYRHAKGNKCKEWCIENFVNHRHAEMVEKVRTQLRELCLTQNIQISTCHSDTELIRKALCYGLFLHAAELDPSKTYRIMDNGLNAGLHPSSCLFQQKPGVVIYDELTLTNQLCMRDVTLVDPQWLIEAAPDYFRSKHLRFV